MSCLSFGVAATHRRNTRSEELFEFSRESERLVAHIPVKN